MILVLGLTSKITNSVVYHYSLVLCCVISTVYISMYWPNLYFRNNVKTDICDIGRFDLINLSVSDQGTLIGLFVSILFSNPSTVLELSD